MTQTFVVAVVGMMKVERYLMVQKSREIERRNSYTKIGDLYTMWWKISELFARLEDFSQLDQKQHTNVTCFCSKSFH